MGVVGVSWLGKTCEMTMRARDSNSLSAKMLETSVETLITMQ